MKKTYAAIAAITLGLVAGLGLVGCGEKKPCCGDAGCPTKCEADCHCKTDGKCCCNGTCKPACNCSCCSCK